jgi:hypothetical protein
MYGVRLIPSGESPMICWVLRFSKAVKLIWSAVLLVNGIHEVNKPNGRLKASEKDDVIE